MMITSRMCSAHCTLCTVQFLLFTFYFLLVVVVVFTFYFLLVVVVVDVVVCSTIFVSFKIIS